MTGVPQPNQFARSAWTDERVETLKRMWAARASQGEIAAELKASRSAIAGKINTLGLARAKGGGQRIRRRSPKPRAERPKGTIQNPTRIMARQGRRSGATARYETPSDGQGLRLLELTNCTCRWPKGEPGADDFRFCGHSGADLAAGRPYCSEHTAKARAV